MPKTGRNIYKRKDGRWEGRYPKGRNASGNITYGYVYSRTFTEVKRHLSVLSNEKPAPAAPETTPEKHNLTFSEVANQWLSIISLKVKSSTYAGYIAILDLHILPSLGRYNMRSLTALDIGRFAKAKLENGRVDGRGGLSAKTVRDMLSIIKIVVDFAYNEKIIGGTLSITYPKQQKRTMRVLSRQEQLSLESVLTAELDVYKLGILLCLYTGLRVGELCALRWQDISDDFNTLSVSQTLQRVKNTSGGGNKTRILIDTPKSPRSVRDVPIPRFLTPYLRSFARKDGAYVISTEDSIFTEPRTMQNHFSKSVKAANISSANYHSLRHTFSTRCIEAGMDIKSLSEILGHANVNITLNRYVHSSFEQKREGMNKLEQYIAI
jgi:integrase